MRNDTARLVRTSREQNETIQQLIVAVENTQNVMILKIFFLNSNVKTSL